MPAILLSEREICSAIELLVERDPAMKAAVGRSYTICLSLRQKSPKELTERPGQGPFTFEATLEKREG